MTPTELRLGLLAINITPAPSTINKEVLLPQWSTRVVDQREIRSWEPRRDWPNTSARTADHPCLDIDVLDAEVASAIEQLVRNRFDGRGEMLLRIGRPPKRLIPFRTDTPFAKRTICYTAPNGMPHRVEFLGAGQQAVFFGMHQRGEEYYWPGGRDPLKVPPSEWVTITEAEADQLLAEIDELLLEQFNYTRVAPPGPNGSVRTSIHVDDIDAALQSLHYAGVGGGGNVHDVSVGCINALIVRNTAADVAVEEVLAARRLYAATNPLCAGWDWEKMRRRLEAAAYSFINKFPNYADRLPPALYAERQVRRGQGVLDPQLVYDRVRKLWYYPEPSPSAANGNAAGTIAGNGSQATAGQKFRLIPFGQLRPGDDPGYLVDELMPLRGIVLIWGKRKCLKSFWTYDLCFHITHYPEYRGRFIQSGGAVVYCAFEGAHGYKKRAEALRRYHKIPDDIEVPLYLLPGRVNMVKEHPLLISAVREQLMGELPRVVVLDTLNKSLVGSESKDVDMAAYIVAAEALRDAFDCVVIIIHHCGYDESHARGHTSLAGAVDAEFEVVREGMLVTVKNITMRDGSDGFEIRSAAEVIEVGEDINGKTLTSLVIVPTDAPAAAPRKKSGRPNVGLPILVDALRRALADRGGIFRPVSEKAAVHAACETEVKQRFDEAYPAGETTPEKIQDATDSAYRRALHTACTEQKIGKGTGPGGNVMLWFKVLPPS